LPIEFSGAAYRFGHGTVQSKYHLNDNNDAFNFLNRAAKNFTICQKNSISRSRSFLISSATEAFNAHAQSSQPFCSDCFILIQKALSARHMGSSHGLNSVGNLIKFVKENRRKIAHAKDLLT
jgi:hypothetical protein